MVRINSDQQQVVNNPCKQNIPFIQKTFTCLSSHKPQPSTDGRLVISNKSIQDNGKYFKCLEYTLLIGYW